MLTPEQRAEIVIWCKAVVAKANSMHWLFDQRSTVNQAACAVLPHNSAVRFSWSASEIQNIWSEVIYG